MYFKLSKKTFMDNLNIVSKAISPLSPLPVLHNIKISTKEDSIKFTSSDSNLSIESTVYANDENQLSVFETGSILLDSKYLNDMVRRIDSDSVELEVVDGTYTYIRGGAINYELNGIKADNYPLIDFSIPEDSFVLSSQVLKDTISQTCFAASDKETRPVLTGLNFNCNGTKLVCVATDSYKLAQKKIELDMDHNFNVTIPAKTMNDVAKIISTENDVKIAFDEKKALFIIDDVLVQTRLIDGLYPETSRLIPTEFAYELTVDARDILNAIDGSSFIKNDGVCIIKMEMDENEVNITNRANDAVSSAKILPISYTGAPLSISFKGNYVYDAIRALNALQVKICFTGNMKPFILQSADNDDVLQLVLPIKTYA